MQNLRPGSLEALGLGADVLTKKFPRLIYCSVWAFGRTGPLKMKPGYEPMVQAFSGLMMMNGDEGGPPTRIGTSGKWSFNASSMPLTVPRLRDSSADRRTISR